MTTKAIQNPLAVELNSQILFDRPNCLMCCRVVEVREKAVRVDYANEPISLGNGVTVFSYTCWIPKSVIVADKFGDPTVKKWFSSNFKGGLRIKKYFMKEGKQIFV